MNYITPEDERELMRDAAQKMKATPKLETLACELRRIDLDTKYGRICYGDEDNGYEIRLVKKCLFSSEFGTDAMLQQIMKQCFNALEPFLAHGYWNTYSVDEDDRPIFVIESVDLRHGAWRELRERTGVKWRRP